MLKFVHKKLLQQSCYGIFIRAIFKIVSGLNISGDVDQIITDHAI